MRGKRRRRDREKRTLRDDGRAKLTGARSGSEDPWIQDDREKERKMQKEKESQKKRSCQRGIKCPTTHPYAWTQDLLGDLRIRGFERLGIRRFTRFRRSLKGDRRIRGSRNPRIRESKDSWASSVAVCIMVLVRGFEDSTTLESEGLPPHGIYGLKDPRE